MRIGEVSARTGVSVRAIRHYESAKLLRANRRANGYRDFGEAAVRRVQAIRDLLAIGLTIDEIVSLSECIECSTTSPDCCESTKALYRTKLARVNEQLVVLTALRDRIEQRIGVLGTC